MSDLQYYLRFAEDDKEKAQLLSTQYFESVKGSITCNCGQKRVLRLAYRCLYCGEWLCFSCAEKHFGVTVKQWRKLKRKEERATLTKL